MKKENLRKACEDLAAKNEVIQNRIREIEEGLEKKNDIEPKRKAEIIAEMATWKAQCEAMDAEIKELRGLVEVLEK